MAEGKCFFSDNIMVDLFDSGDSISKSDLVEKSLTNRENQILNLIFNEKSIQEIADELNLGFKTIDVAKKQLMKKVGVKSPIGLVKYALRMRLVSLDAFA